jgi:hypothetical protein
VEATSFPALDKPEPRFRIEFSTVEFPAAIQARHRPLDPPDPMEFLSAASATIQKTPRPLFHGKGQGMAARFAGDAEIAAGAFPFRTVRRNPPAPGAKLGQQMGEFVAQSALDFSGVVLAEARIQRDKVTVRIRPAGGAEEPGVPFHLDFPGEIVGAQSLQNFARVRLESGIASKNDERWLRRKNEVELLMTELAV